MSVNLEQTASVWMRQGKSPSRAPLASDMSADVCVVGAGIAGLTTAYLLSLEGRSVIVLDDGPVGGGQSERTTAHLASAIDDRYVQIERWHGVGGARLAAESHAAAIDRIEAISQREQIECEFERVDGFLFAPPGASQDCLQPELLAARRAGLDDVELLSRCPLTFDTGPCLRFPRQAQFHPLKYMAGLLAAIIAKGGAVFTQTHVDRIESGPPARVRTSQGRTVTAASVVVATNTPFNDLVTMHTRQAAYLTYALAFGVPRGMVTRALYWDTENPYHYVRLESISEAVGADAALGDAKTEELLIVGGEDHKSGQADDAEARYDRLEAWTRERFPVNPGRRCRWSGQVLETNDGLAFIGKNPLDGPNVYIATGDSGQGMTHGTIAGIVLTDLIVGRMNCWSGLYDPSRFIATPGRFLFENANVALQYGAWLTSGDVASTDSIAKCEGAVVRRGLVKIAAYRDEFGALHERSAICPHLGCIVQWNQNESSWDCPCHGARFDNQGRLLCGPANRDLAETATKDAFTVPPT